MSISKKNINNDFIEHFPEIYLSPNKINKYLKNHSKHIENIILKNFNDFNLEDDFSIYANGGFGREEMFPSSDIDISIIQNKKTESKPRYSIPFFLHPAPSVNLKSIFNDDICSILLIGY